MIKSYSVIRSFGHSVIRSFGHSVIRSFGFLLALSSCSWKSPPLVCALILFSSCNGGESSGGGGVAAPPVTTAPSAPTSLSLVTPGSSPGLDSTPTISVGGVVSGDTVKLFSDSACTSEIGSATAFGTSVNVTVSSSLAVSSHSVYANSTNAIGTSPCSSVSVSYTLASCPAEFIPVPHNTDLGTTKDFCVMKYEAKNNGSNVAVSQAADNPYVSINIGDSQTKCTDLNALNSVTDKYDLISNQEWMTIARNAESVSSNFQAGVMARGWAAHISNGDTWSNSAVAPSTDANCLYNTGADTCASSGDHLYKRTLTLSNSEEIWDLSGNVREWVDWSASTPGLQLGPTTCALSWVEFTALPSDSCYGGALSANEVLPATSNGSSVEGLGRFYGGSGGAAFRGGNWNDGSNAGAFTLVLYYSSTATRTNFGFRCVYRP